MGLSTSTSASKSNLLVAVLTGVLVFIMAARTPLDSDLFWHLKTGEDMLALGHPVLVDMLSYTRAGTPWVNHSWFAQIILALLWKVGDYLALGAWVALSATLSMMLVYRRMSAPPLWRTFVVILACLVAAPVWSPRPQLFSLVLLAGLANFLDAWQAGRARGWWLIPMFILWSNLHGGYALGVILIVCWIAGELLNHLTGREGALPLRRVLALAGWGLLAWLAVAVNPNGAAMWQIPFQTVGVGALQQAIPEWASPDFHDLTQQPFLWMLLGLLGAIGLSGRRVDGKALALVVVFCAMGLVARRNFGPFALLAAPILAEHGWTVFERMIQRLPRLRSSDRPVPPRVGYVLNLTIAGMLIFTALVKLYVVTQPVLVDYYMRQSYPVGAANWLRFNCLSGNIFSSYAWGGYIELFLPGHKVFLDGRTDLFGDELIREWSDTASGQAGWRETLERYAVTYVLLEPEWPLLDELEQAGWRVYYTDERAVIYGR
jgi:hypothetical protein